MLVAYKSDFNTESLKELVRLLLYGRHIDSRVKEQVIEDILDAHRIGNLDNQSLNLIIMKWNEKVRK